MVSNSNLKVQEQYVEARYTELTNVAYKSKEVMKITNSYVRPLNTVNKFEVISYLKIKSSDIYPRGNAT